MKHNVYIFGEMHTTEERLAIEKEIIKLHSEGKIDFLLTEEAGSNKAFTAEECESLINTKDYSISDRSYKLGITLNIPVIGIDDWRKATYSEDKNNREGKPLNRVKSFNIRESTMALLIADYALLGNCAVIVGDSHLRGKPNSVMGEPSPIIKYYLNDPKVKIYRSPNSELKENNVVIVSGMQFNAHAYDRLISLGDALAEEEKQYQNQAFFTKINSQPKKYELNQFIHPNKETFCYVVDNTIVAMIVAIKKSDKIVILSSAITDNPHRNKGYMSILFNAVFDRYPKETFGIGIEVLSLNERAKKLYERMGFIPHSTALFL